MYMKSWKSNATQARWKMFDIRLLKDFCEGLGVHCLGIFSAWISVINVENINVKVQGTATLTKPLEGFLFKYSALCQKIIIL